MSILPRLILTTSSLPTLSPSRDVLLSEGPDSPYGNIVAVREDDKNDPRLKQLILALHSAEVLSAAKKIFGDGAIPAWK